MPLSPVVAKAELHFWEEPPISGKNGSGAVFFSGCPLSCVFCQNYAVSHNGKGKMISIGELADIFKELEQKGAHNINLVTPTHYSLAIKQALDIYRPNIPIVYNCSGYESTETLKMLKDYIDIYLFDFKYISEDKAERFSSAPDYPSVAKKALAEAYSQRGECIFNKDGIMSSGIIVRHLLMPQATNDAIRVFELVKTNFKNAYFSLMSQYIPFGEAKGIYPINRRITAREYDKVVSYIEASGFESCYIQELSSASEKYIPDFD